MSEPDESRWIEIYTGFGLPVRLVEEELAARGIRVLKEHSRVDTPGPFTHGPERACYTLRVSAIDARDRQAEIEAALQRAEGQTEDPEAMAEAEEDYDVRACPACGLYFHDTYVDCPGCRAELVPAVEIFSEGQLEPDRVVIAHGDAAAMHALAARLQEARFDAAAFEEKGWPVAAVDLPWPELTDRTAEVEALLREP